jgi:hypothetical protein
MDSTRFDALSRSLAIAANRRAFMRAAFAAVAGGIGGVLGRASASADGCKEDGKQCKKHQQCCSGLCAPPSNAESTAASDSVCCTPDSNETTCSGRCGTQTNNCGQTVNCGECCVPDVDELTCAGLCGTQTNNCGSAVDCGKCGDEICLASAECAGGNCCAGKCCDQAQPSTYACCGEQGCCDCFSGENLVPTCYSADHICGTYPTDQVCSASTTCFNGDCVRGVYLCPFETGGELAYCTGATGAGCCGGLCCPHDTPICADGVCVAVQTCSYPDNMDCAYGTCTASKWNPDNGTCCTNIHSFQSGTDGTTGEPIIINQCCRTDQKWDALCHCNALHWEGCQEPTSRTSYPRIG